MNYWRNLSILAYVLTTTVAVSAQSDPPAPPPPRQQANESVQERQASPCPQVLVGSPTPRSIHEGQTVSFTAQIKGGDRNVTPSLLWNISAGSIRDGQGTAKIEVDTSGAGEYRMIDAELWIGGYPPECPTQSQPYRINVIPPAAKLDEFGAIPVEAENEKLALAVKAAQFGNDRVYVIGYAGRNSERFYTSTSLRRMRDQILRSGLPATRVSAYDGGFREAPAFELWIVPEGAEPPKPTPTIDRKEIVFPRTTRTTRGTPARKP